MAFVDLVSGEFGRPVRHLLGQQRDAPCGMPADVAARGVQLSGEDAEQGGLSGTVRAGHDEPVAALDPVTAKQVMQDFVHINQEMGISILLNIHHVELALEYADRIIGIRAGKIVYDGPSANVDQSVLDAIYGDDSETEADA